MKQIYINKEPTTYFILEDGRLLNKKTNNYYKGTISQGYLWYDLRWKNKKYRKSCHRLLAEYYLNNPDNLPCVHHKDGNKMNNNLENLKWVSWSENNLSKNKKTSIAGKHDWKQKKFPEEIWLPYKNTIYMISNYGRVKNTKTNKILKGKITSNGYREYCLKLNNKKSSITAHKMVAQIFLNKLDDDNLIINHKDGDKLNNYIQNLELVTQKQNNIHKLYVLENHQYKSVGQYDKENNLIQTFSTCAAAARYMKVTPQSINKAIHANYCSCGYYWKYIE